MPPGTLPEDEFDAELRDWALVAWQSPTGTWPVVFGRVWDDRKGRFPDGRLIHTSVVLSPWGEIAGGRVIRTLNTRYLLRGTAH